MATAATLPISNLISVSVSLAPVAAQAQNLSVALVLTSDTVIDVVSRRRIYSTLAAVSTDFGTSSPAFFAAQEWFAQAPQPTTIQIGRWAKTNTAGQLFCGPLSAANTLLTAWTAISNGSFHIAIDGGGPSSITGLNFSAATSLNGVASIIQAALTGATCTYDAVNNRFFFTSSTTGASSSISFLTAGTGGTDISVQLNGRNTAGNGAYVANGILAETAVAAAALFDTLFGQQWYALIIPEAVDSDHQAVAAFIEATNTKHYYGVTTQEAGVLVAATSSDIASLLQAAGFNKTAVQYSGSSAYAIMSYLARIMTTDYTGNNTVITLMYKQEPGITAELLNATQAASAKGKNCNVFVAYNNNTAIIQFGTSASGQFTDNIIGADAFAVDLQTAYYNALFTMSTKVAQTDRGTNILVTALTAVCIRYVNNGFLAAGVWTNAGFGTLQTGQQIPGYYIFAPPVAQQSQASRAARIAVPIQIAGKLAGAVHTGSVAVTLNP